MKKKEKEVKEVKEKKNYFKMMFGGINLTWKRLIIFAVIAGVYTAIMALLPITYDTSFRDIAIMLEWWILMGIIIISNSKSPLDSALKCFVFFLISQPLVYLVQVPFSSMGWGLFGYYRYWFIVTLFTFPMGFIGYYINKRNWLSALILLPMLVFLAYLGLGYFSSAVDNFPHHLLSCISCFGMIIIIVLCMLDDLKLRLATFGVVIVSLIVCLIMAGGINNGEYESYRTLEEFDIELNGTVLVSSFTATGKGEVTINNVDDTTHIVRLFGRKKEIYEFTITDESNMSYNFKYYFDKSNNIVQLDYLGGEVNE